MRQHYCSLQYEPFVLLPRPNVTSHTHGWMDDRNVSSDVILTSYSRLPCIYTELNDVKNLKISIH